MRAGDLRHRITVEQLTVSNVGEATDEAWTTFAANVPADIRPMSGREILAAAAADSGQRVRFVIRYGNAVGIVPTMRVVHDALHYNITEVVPDPSLRDHVTLIAEAGIRG